MEGSGSQGQKVLITGGTSGLGYQLVKVFLEKGCHVVTTGRREVKVPGYEERLSLYIVDFSDLKETARVFRQIAEDHRFDLIINNAGILSPPDRKVTTDGFEYTLQVNFLAHLLSNEIILRNFPIDKPVRIASVTSPVYKLSSIESGVGNNRSYRPLKAYSDSKLYLALMAEYISSEHKDKKIICFGFNPGVFGSGIYRMQSSFFSFLYGIAAPFMRSPSKVAKALGDLITAENIQGNVIYKLNKHINPLPESKKDVTETFWKECYEKIHPFL